MRNDVERVSKPVLSCVVSLSNRLSKGVRLILDSRLLSQPAPFDTASTSFWPTQDAGLPFAAVVLFFYCSEINGKLFPNDPLGLRGGKNLR